MDPFLESLVKILLKKGTDTNTFISDEADKALTTMAYNCQETKVLTILLNSNVNSKANTLRQKICKCLGTLIKALGNNILFFKENDKLLS
jgi:hypothetical protein